MVRGWLTGSKHVTRTYTITCAQTTCTSHHFYTIQRSTLSNLQLLSPYDSACEFGYDPRTAQPESAVQISYDSDQKVKME
jgi:hypothetical protein